MGIELPVEWSRRAASAALMAGCHEVCFELTGELRPTEGVEPRRACALIHQIATANIWTRAILIEATTKAVMDGHHRLNAARSLGLARVPCIRLSYGDPRLRLLCWREDFLVTPEVVLASARTGTPLPPRTSRHLLTPSPGSLRIPLDLLRAAQP